MVRVHYATKNSFIRGGQTVAITPGKERQKAYIERAKKAGLKRVSVMVPENKVEEIKKIAKEMYSSKLKEKSQR